MKVLMIHNPVAGTHSPEEFTKMTKEFFNAKRWDYDIHTTSKDEDTPAIVAEKLKNDYDLVIASGGDGTVSAVAGGIDRKNIPLGILPAGTGNALSIDLKIPQNLEQALALIAEKPALRSIDAFTVDNQLFLLNLSIGFTALTIKKANRKLKRKYGRLAYLVSGLESFIGIQPHTFHLKIDGKPHTVEASEIILFNSVTMGDAGQFFNLGVENNDQKLDLFILKSKSIIDYFHLFINFILRRPKQAPTLDHYEVSDQLSIQTNKRLYVQADGELIAPSPVEVRIIPQAVNIIVPEEAQAL